MDAMQLLKLFQNQEVNVRDEERMLSAFTGGVMLAESLFGKKKPLKIAMGAYLLYRGLSGHCPAYSVMRKFNPTPETDELQAAEGQPS